MKNKEKQLNKNNIYYTSLRNKTTKNEYLCKVDGKELDNHTFIYDGKQIFGLSKWYVVDIKTGKAVASGNTKKEALADYLTIKDTYAKARVSDIYKALIKNFKKMVNAEQKKIEKAKGGK